MALITLPPDLANSERRGPLARPLASRGRRDWCRIEAKADEEATIYIYDEIGYWGTTAGDFVKDLQAITARRISLHLNTPGGDFFDGIAIHNALRQHPAAVTVYVDSLAASIGSVIAMAGERVIMAPHSTMMIHDPVVGVYGYAEDLRKWAEVLDQLGDTIAGVYAERGGGSVREWRDRMLEESWYSDREAVDIGLADGVDGDAAAENGFDLSVFKHPPDQLAAAARAPTGGQPTKRDVERALRDAGLSRSQAKAFVAKALGDCGELEGEARDASNLIALRDAIKILL